jgi:hypothetical protein
MVDDEPAPAGVWLRYYARLIGAPPPPPGHGRWRGERGASNAKARQQLGWQSRYPSWREGMATRLG